MSINSFDTISSIYSEMVNNELVITLNQADTHNPPMIIKLDKKDYYNITYRDNDGNKQVLENVVITDAYMSDGSNPDKYTLNLEEGNYRSLPDKIYKYERDNNEELILKCSDVLFYNDIKTSSSHFKDSGIKINLSIPVNEYLNLINYKKSIRFDAVLDNNSENIQWTLDGKNVDLFYDYYIELDYNHYESSINDGDYIILETSLNEMYEKDNKYIPASSIISINKHAIENNKDDGINIVYKLQNCNCNGKEKYDSNTSNIEIELYPDDGYEIYLNNIRVYLISSMESVSSNFISFSFSDYNTITLSNGTNGMHPYIIISVVATKIIDEPYIYTLSKDKSYYIFGSDIDSIEDLMSNKLQLSDNTYVNHAAFDYNCEIPICVHLDKSSESFDIEFDKNPYYYKYDDELEYTLTYHEDNGWYDGSTYISDYDLENTYGITIIAGEPVENDSIHIVFKRISNIVIPEYYNGLPVKAISSYALMYSDIENIEIPNTIEYIGDEAFANDYYIKKIIIPDSVKNIGIGLFYTCYNIDTVYLSNQMSCIPKYTFAGSGIINLNSESSIINIPSNIKVIEEGAFSNITGGYIKIPKSIIEYNGAFKSSNPYYIELEYGLKTISDNAFNGCSLTNITIPDSVTSIGKNAFKYCDSLINIDIPDSVTSIGDSAFYGCTSLINITIPDNVISIGDSVFYQCHDLINVTILDNITSIGDSAFENCSSLTSITLPDSIISIGNGAFRECSSLTSITIPDSVISIGSYAFDYCDIDNLILGTGLKEIGYCGFSNNSNLVNVHVPKNVDIANYAFQGCGIEFIELDDDAYKYPDYLYAGTSITEIIVPENIKYLGKGTFENSALTTITLHEDITELPYAVFNNCSNLEFTITDNIVSIGDYSININNVSDYSFLNKLSRIPSGFFGDSAIEEFEIPDNITSIGDSAFENCSSLTSITIPDSVTSIGDSAFGDCTSLTTITIPDSVTSIGDYAFNGCTTLTTINIPDSVSNIGIGAFGGCSSLDSITIPDSVTSIGDYVFYHCTSLASITIPNGVTTIGKNAFEDCSSLTSITLPDSVTSIGNGAFAGCSSLTNITIPDSVTNIKSSTFEQCTSLTSIIIPDSVISIGSFAFYRCNLKYIDVGSGLKTIGYRAFDYYDDDENKIEELHTNSALIFRYIRKEYLEKVVIGNKFTAIPSGVFEGCTSLDSITIPDSVISIGDYAFDYCTSLASITIPNSVTSIGNGAFSYCSSLASITLPDNITSIGSSTFENCTSLTTITLPNNITSIRDYTFVNCTSLASITIPNSVTSIGDDAFNGCSSLTSITIPDSVTSIGDYVFYGCTSLASITLPNSVTSIGDSVFYGCTSLASITIPNSVTSIGDHTFGDCTSLTTITIPDSVTSIGDSAFDYCTSLISITLPDSVTSIGNGAFRACTSLDSITIPNNITNIGDHTFEDCTSLTTIILPNNITSIGDSVFYGCTSLASITIPNSVTSIGDNAFRACTSLDSITIPNSVITIGDCAFYYCTFLTSITIPNSVTSIGDYVFEDCSSLTNIIIPDSITSIGDSAFSYCYSLTTITIPDSITSIKSCVFNYCTSLEDLYIYGTNIDYSEIDSKSGSIVYSCDKDKLTIHVKELPTNEYWNYIDDDTVATTVVDL